MDFFLRLTKKINLMHLAKIETEPNYRHLYLNAANRERNCIPSMFGDTSLKANYGLPVPPLDEPDHSRLQLAPLHTMRPADMPGEGAFGLTTYVEHVNSGALRMLDCRALPAQNVHAVSSDKPADHGLRGVEHARFTEQWQSAEMAASQIMQTLSAAGDECLPPRKRVHDNRIHTGRAGVGIVACVLSKETALHIYMQSKADAVTLAKFYGVTKTTVYNIMNRKTWTETTKHLWSPSERETYERQPKRRRGHAPRVPELR